MYPRVNADVSIGRRTGIITGNRPPTQPAKEADDVTPSIPHAHQVITHVLGRRTSSVHSQCATPAAVTNVNTMARQRTRTSISFEGTKMDARYRSHNRIE